MKIEAKIGSQIEMIDATRQGDELIIEWDGRRQVAELIRVDGTEILFRLNGRMIRLVGQKNGQGRQLWVNGRLANYQRVMAGSEEEDNDGDGALSASIPAVVVDVLVAEGDQVEAGDQLILLEST